MKDFFIFLSMISVCFADAYQEGQAYAKTNETKPSLESTKLNPSANPIENSYTHESMRAKLEQEVQTNETFLQIKKAQKERPEFEIEVTIPAVEGAIAQEGREEVSTEEGSDKISDFIEKKCMFSGQRYTQTCRRQLVIALAITPEIKRDQRYCPHGGEHVLRGGAFRKTRSCAGCETRSVIVQAKKVDVIQEEWVGCEDLEEMRDRGEAEVLSETPGLQNETRIINGEPVTREYFETTRVYALNTKVINTCEPLRALECQQINSRCTQEKQLLEGPKICLMFEKIYKCPLMKTSKNRTKNKLGLDIPKGPQPVANQNMVQALSQLEAIKQMSLLKTIDGDKVTFMKGDAMSCTTNFGGSFKDCCKSNGGFGASMHMATKCSAEEKNLQRAKQEGRCVFVGSRKKNNALGINFSKEYRYCCFPTRLSLAIQSGARTQLGKNFGSADVPSCEGLNPEDLKHVDFSQIDLSDTFKDIMESMNKMKSTVRKDFSHLQNRFATKTRDPVELDNTLKAAVSKRMEKGEDDVY